MKTKLVYIKLGIHSEWADDCFQKGIIRIGFIELSDELFKTEDLDKIRKKYNELGYPNGAVNIYLSQLRIFFESDQDTIWITFHQQKLWWCRTKAGYHLDKDKTRFKEVIEGWSEKDINGNILWEDNLSGALLKTKSYLSTICVPEAEEYAWNKIHGIKSKDVIQFEIDLVALKKSTLSLIQRLTWWDFEILVDLIFRNAGFQRLGVIGKSVKTIDLSLLHPLNKEKIFVQIKSAATLNTYLEWKKEMEIEDSDFTKYYFAVHSPSKDLKSFDETDKELFVLWREKEIGGMVMQFGLIDSLVQKVS